MCGIIGVEMHSSLSASEIRKALCCIYGARVLYCGTVIYKATNNWFRIILNHRSHICIFSMLLNRLETLERCDGVGRQSCVDCFVPFNRIPYVP